MRWSRGAVIGCCGSARWSLVFGRFLGGKREAVALDEMLQMNLMLSSELSLEGVFQDESVRHGLIDGSWKALLNV